MTGFEQTCLHLSHTELTTVRFTVQVDFCGDRDWHTVTDLDVGSSGYRCHCFEPGFSAHWVRLVRSHNCERASAQFAYT